MAVEQAAERSIDHPGDRRVGPTSPQGRQDGKGIDDVAEGARLDQADATRGQRAQVFERGGRHPGELPFPCPWKGDNVTQSPPGHNAGYRATLPWDSEATGTPDVWTDPLRGIEPGPDRAGRGRVPPDRRRVRGPGPVPPRAVGLRLRARAAPRRALLQRG